jgi:hypothetical protein
MIGDQATTTVNAVDDHEAAREAIASSLDFPLRPEAQAALDVHLDGCAACRSFAAAAGRDAATLRELDFGPVPVAVRAGVATAADRRRRTGRASRWVAVAATAAILLVGLGGGALMVGGGGRVLGIGGGNQVDWKTNVVQFKADDFWIDANGQRFYGSAKADVHSDPGDASYRTLELTWQEHGVEMRMNLYFTGDGSTTWIKEIRVYDGTSTPKWKTVDGRYAAVPLEATWTGDLDIDFPGSNGGPAHLHAAGATIESIPFDAVTEPRGSAITLGQNDAPFAAGGALHCSGILQMTPQAAERVLLGLGYKVSWRLNTTTGANTGYAEPLAHAPDGVIVDQPVPGTHGELVVFVAPKGDPRAIAVPVAADCPNGDPNASPAAPKR